MKSNSSFKSDLIENLEDVVYGMPAHTERLQAVNEIHARPHLSVDAPSCMLQLAFMTDGDKHRDNAALKGLSDQLGIELREGEEFLHDINLRDGRLHCEKHLEFSTYLWCTAINPETHEILGEDPFKRGFVPPGPVVSGVRLTILPFDSQTEDHIARFDFISPCYSKVENGLATIVTDFRQDEDGITNALIIEKGLKPDRIGALAQCLFEIETYRTLAMIAIPLTRTMALELRNMESTLALITEEMRSDPNSRRESDVLLSELTSLAADLEASAAANLYRFGASRAYYEIVQERLSSLSEQSMPGYCTWYEFLERRIAPAMRTCQSVKERQAKLSDKLTRAISLLRSWIDVELERQNRDLLASMNNRAQLQLRLQQTVEGLSVAAISYYIVGLLSYIVKGMPFIYKLIVPEIAIAITVPLVTLFVWWVVHKIRAAHTDPQKHP